MPFLLLAAHVCELGSCASRLEPMAGAALAINLAYLNLPRFRYRSQIKEHSAKEIKRLEDVESPVPAEFLNNKWYKQVQRFANHPGTRTQSLVSTDAQVGDLTKMPDEIWWWVYRFAFGRGQDLFVSAAAALISGFSLAAGVSHSIAYLLSLEFLFQNGFEVGWFWLLGAAMILPLTFIGLGSRVVRWGQSYTTECVTELLKLMQAKVKDAKLVPDSNGGP